MKSLTGLCLILLAGCRSVPVHEEDRHPLPHVRTAEVALPPSTSTHIRVGVEYLPQATGSHAHVPRPFLRGAVPQPPAQPGLQVRPLPQGPPPPTPESTRRFWELQERWELTREQIRSKSNPIERVTLRFLSELIGDDRKRVHRAIGAPLLGSQLRLSTDPLSNFLDERDRADHQRNLTRNGTHMIRRPMRNALKELPLFRDLEMTIHEFKATQKIGPRKKGVGRISMRIHAGDLSDPVELRWIRGGFRLASSTEYGKLSYGTHLTDGLQFKIWTRFDYDNSDFEVFGDLQYELNDYTNFHALAGNGVNILGGPMSYPGGPQSEDQSKGVLFYFEHQF